MQRRVREYKIPLDDTFTLSIPKVSQFLGISNQDDHIYLLYLIDSKSSYKKVHFIIVESNKTIDTLKYEYLGSFGLRNWSLKYHLFVEK